MPKKKIKYTDEPMEDIEVIADFLPPPEELAFSEERVAEVELNKKGPHVTQLLTRAFEKASQLPEADQIAFANFILAELTSDLRWQQAFDSSQEALAQLAEEALIDRARNSKNKATAKPWLNNNESF